MTKRIRRSELEGISESDFAHVVEVHAKDLRDYRDHHVLKDSEDEFWQSYPMPWTLPIIRSAINPDTLQPDYVIIDSRGQISMKIIARLALGCALALIPTIAIGQSGCPTIITGAVLTAGQWNSCFIAKQDFLGFTPLNPSSLVGTTPISVTAGAGVVTISLSTGTTGTGNVVLANTPTLLTPVLGDATGSSLWLAKGITVAPADAGAGTLSVNLTRIDSDNVDAGAGFIIGHQRRYIFGGSTAKGGRIAGYDFTANTAITNSANANRNYVGTVSTAYTTVGDGGSDTSTNAKGAYFGANPAVHLDTGATNVFNASAFEADITLSTGSSARYAVGGIFTGFNAVRGTEVDSAIAIGGGTGHIGWKNGILFSDFTRGTTQNPFYSASTIIGTYWQSGGGGVPTVTAGVDFGDGATTGFLFTGNAFRSKGFAVSATGAITAQTPFTITDSGGSAIIGLTGSANASLSVRPSGTGAFQVQNATGGNVSVYSNDAGATASTNYYNFKNAAAAGTPLSQVEGTDTNIPWAFRTKGTGSFIWQTAGGTQLLAMTTTGHWLTPATTAPTLSAGCTGAGSGVVGSDTAGTVTGSTAAATTCTLTFATSYAGAPHCVAMGISSPLTGTATAATGTLVVNFASTANYKFSYVCPAQSGG